MQCPICSNSTGVEIDMHSDGYAKDLFECTSCGALWITECDETIMMIKKVA